MTLKEEISKMKTIMGLITEVKNIGPIYHYTTFNNAEKIMDSNMLKGSYNELEDRKYPVISFTRNKNLHHTNYHKSAGDSFFVRFVLDSEKLSFNYNLRPYQHPLEIEFGKINFFGAEERVIASKIYPLDKYLIKIEIISSMLEKVLSAKKDFPRFYGNWNEETLQNFIDKYNVEMV